MEKVISDEQLQRMVKRWAEIANQATIAEATQGEDYEFALGAVCGYGAALVALGLVTLDECRAIQNSLQIVARERVTQAMRRLISLN